MGSSLVNKRIYWSAQEISLLKKLYPKTKVKHLLTKFPRRNKATIVAKAGKLGLPSAKLWQRGENKVLHKYFAESTKNNLTKLLPKRSWSAILIQGERLKLKRKTNKPTLKVNESYFKKWSANMAYILGFIFADGNITKITDNGYSDKLGFGLHRKDIDVLKKIKKELSAEQKLSLSGNYVYLSIFSQIIVDDLKKLGISYRKSFTKTLQKIPNIPKKYIKDFIRGVVDGDGSIHFDRKGYPTLSICGRRETMMFIKNHFLSNFNIYSKLTQPKYKNKLSNVFYITYRCSSAKTLVRYLYKNANIYLERKFTLARKSLNIIIRKKSRKKILIEQYI